MSDCKLCGGRRKSPVVDKETGHVHDMQCPQCVPGGAEAIERALSGPATLGGGIEQDPAIARREAVQAEKDKRMPFLTGLQVVDAQPPMQPPEREPRIVTQARVTIDMLNELAGVQGTRPLLWKLLSTGALRQAGELDQYGSITYTTSDDAADCPFSWTPRAEIVRPEISETAKPVEARYATTAARWGGPYCCDPPLPPPGDGWELRTTVAVVGEDGRGYLLHSWSRPAS